MNLTLAIIVITVGIGIFFLLREVWCWPEDVVHLLRKMWKRRYAREPLPEEWVRNMISPRYYGQSVRQSPRMNGTEAATL